MLVNDQWVDSPPFERVKGAAVFTAVPLRQARITNRAINGTGQEGDLVQLSSTFDHICFVAVYNCSH